MALKYASPQRRRLPLAMAAIVVLLSLSAPALFAQQTLAASENRPNLKTVEISVEGMACVACAASVRRTLKSLDGVSRVEVNLEKRSARVTYAPAQISPAAMTDAINKLGYKAGTPKEVQ